MERGINGEVKKIPGICCTNSGRSAELFIDQNTLKTFN